MSAAQTAKLEPLEPLLETDDWYVIDPIYAIAGEYGKPEPAEPSEDLEEYSGA